MKLKLHVLALASLVVIGGSVVTSGPSSAGDGFLRYVQQRARLEERSRQRKSARVEERDPWRALATSPKWAAARTKTAKTSGPLGAPSSRFSR
jgi:hypothetical protein